MPHKLQIIAPSKVVRGMVSGPNIAHEIINLLWSWVSFAIPRNIPETTAPDVYPFEGRNPGEEF